MKFKNGVKIFLLVVLLWIVSITFPKTYANININEDSTEMNKIEKEQAFDELGINDTIELESEEYQHLEIIDNKDLEIPLENETDTQNLEHSVSLISTFAELQNAVNTAPTDGTVKMIQLTTNITVTSTITIDAGRHINIISNEDNNKILTAEAHVSIFIIEYTGTLTLNNNVTINALGDSTAPATRIIVNGGILNMHGGTVTGAMSDSSGLNNVIPAGDAIEITNGTFNMYDGAVTGGHGGGDIAMGSGGHGGHGVNIHNGTFNMYNGIVVGGIGGSGGAVGSAMSGTGGHGVNIHSGTFIMNNGILNGGAGGYGGNGGSGGHGVLLNSGTFEMIDGTATGGHGANGDSRDAVSGHGGDGGDGVNVTSDHFTLYNFGVFRGGNGGNGVDGWLGISGTRRGSGGHGVHVTNSSFTLNSGHFTGGIRGSYGSNLFSSDGNATNGLNPTIPTNDNYIFVGWFNTPNSSEGTEITFPLTGPGKRSVYARWAVNIIFNMPYAEGTTIPNQRIVLGQLVTRPTQNPTRKNHTFLNWFTTETGNDLFDFNTPITRNTTIYARWLENRTLTFNWNLPNELESPTGEEMITTIQIPHGQTVNNNEIGSTMPDDPIRSGYTFIGWSLYPILTSQGQILHFRTDYAITEDMNIYARWTSNPVQTITFDLAEGNINNNSYHVIRQIRDGQSISNSTVSPLNNEMPEQPKRDGFIFENWEVITSNATGISKGDIFTSDTLLTQMITGGSIVVRAIWQANSTYLNVSIPTTVLFQSNHINARELESLRFTITNNSIVGVHVDVANFTTIDDVGINLIEELNVQEAATGAIPTRLVANGSVARIPANARLLALPGLAYGSFEFRGSSNVTSETESESPSFNLLLKFEVADVSSTLVNSN